MIERLRCRHFIVRTAGPHAMTIVAIQTLIAAVVGVTEANPECARDLAAANITARLMTHAARGNISIA